MAVLDGEVFSVSFSRSLGDVVVTLAGDLDARTAPTLADRLTDVIDGEGNLAVVVDLERLAFVDSAGVGVLADANGRLRRRGGSLTLRNPSGVAGKVLEITGLTEVLTVMHV